MADRKMREPPPAPDPDPEALYSLFGGKIKWDMWTEGMTLRGVHTRAAIGAVGLRGHADDWWQNWQPPEPRMCPHSWNPTFQEHGEPND